ncbi:hypothetical protein [Streptomyces sp. enrichment culture]|uniref:hypothetical protein n=1 Tax=Streptomyces sp. enrichment culture TaxID=1795815 RepID=UPI003F57D5AC
MDLTRLVVDEPVIDTRKCVLGLTVKPRITGDLVEVSVWNPDPVLPVVRAADAGRASRHEWETAVVVCRDFESRREPAGKRITVCIALFDGLTARPEGSPNSAA